MDPLKTRSFKRWYKIILSGIVSGLILPLSVLLLTPLLIHNSASAQTVYVGLVTDENGLADQAWNWTSYQGLLRAENELGIVGKVYDSNSSADYEPNLQQCVNDGNNLCISIGAGMANATWNKAQANPTVDFAIVDFAWNSGYPTNLRGIDFKMNEAGFLAGTLAALLIGNNEVGVIGGYPTSVVQSYISGYRNGAQQADPNVSVFVYYTYDFSDPTKGQQAAENLITQGVDVIFNVAGQSGSAGLIYAAQQGVWVIGVDFDEYFTTFGGGSVAGAHKLLTSVLKELDLAVFDTINDVVTNDFRSGTVVYDLKRLSNAVVINNANIAASSESIAFNHLPNTQGVNDIGLAPFHDAESSIPQSVIDGVNAVRQGIISGTIDVDFSGRVHLPIILKNLGT